MMDVHIRGERVFPLCELLAAQGVPFVLTSGYADWHMPEKWDDRPRLQKPYTIDQVEEALADCSAAEPHQAESETEVSDVVAGVRAVADEAVLVHVAGLAGESFSSAASKS